MMSEPKNTEHTTEIAQKLADNSNAAFIFALVAVLAMLLIPLPTYLLDIGITFSISIAIAVLIIVLTSNHPTQLSTFPSLLLTLTLFRLSLNVASTRLILLHGDAGSIINTFGNFVAGGNVIVGMVMFIILVVIQFVVITKGSQRISEVAARFVLDALPGKQMAIDADLNAGHITEEEAKERREDIAKESEFYGAMDGASKFISGDVKAGLIITGVNLIGGIILGYMGGMSIIEAMKRYSILSIGDGLVSQIPSLIVSVSSGFLVSKIRTDNTLSYDLTKQMFKNGNAMGIAAMVIGGFALVPGFPKLPFIAISAGCGYFSWLARKENQEKKKEKIKPEEKSEKEESPVEELLTADVLSILVGVRLISMVDPRKKSGIFDRISALRRKFAQQLGFIIPLVRIRDDINLDPSTYQIRVYDHVIAEGMLEPDKFLAMDSGLVQKKIKGIPTKEPVYGLPALWIYEKDKEKAELNGYTVIDPESVLITHLSETIQRNAHELLTREDVQQLVERLRQSQPSLVGDVVGEGVSIGLLQRVLQNLLREGISIRDMPLILEALGENSGRTKNPVLLTEVTRKALKRTITEGNLDSDGAIKAITINPALEHRLISCVNQQADGISFDIDPQTAMQFTKQTAECWKKAMDKGVDNVVLLADPRVRPAVYGHIERAIPRLPVIAYDEISPGRNVESIETVSIESAEKSPQLTGV